MLVVPIIHGRGESKKICNARIKLKEANKIRSKINNFEDSAESEIIVNGQKFSDSIFYSDGDAGILKFIRYYSTYSKQNTFYVTTKCYKDTNYYDLYEVELPPSKINDALDSLYTRMIVDLRKEVPGEMRSYYLSFEQLGFDEYLTDDKISKLKMIIENSKNKERWPLLFKTAGIEDIPLTFDFLNKIECTVVPGSTIDKNDFEKFMGYFKKVKSRDYRQLRKYYEIASNNREIYKKLSNLYGYLNNEAKLNLIQSERQRKENNLLEMGDFGRQYSKKPDKNAA